MECQERVVEHLRIVGERLFRVGDREKQQEQLRKMSTLFSHISSQRSFLLHWPLENPDLLELVPMRDFQQGDDRREYVFYHFITVFREYLTEAEEEEEEEEEKLLCIREWRDFVNLEQVSRLFLEKERVNEYQFHSSEKRVDRETHKLTFPLEDAVVKMSDISYGSSFSWSRPLSDQDSYQGQCQMILINATLYLTETISRSTKVTLFLPGQRVAELNLDQSQYITSQGRIMLEEILQPCDTDSGGVFGISLRSDFSVVFSDGGYAIIKNVGGILCFDMASCLMEYWSRKDSPFPCRFHLHDVDHLLNFERFISGQSPNAMSPGSQDRANRRRLKGGHSDNLERLSLLRSIHVQYVNSFPLFYHQGQPLKVLEFNSQVKGKLPFYILFHDDDFSLAKFRIRPRTLEIDFDLIDHEDSRPYSRHLLHHPNQQPLVY